MVWIGFLLGVGIGYSFWGFQGALVLGFLGWLTGLIVKSNQRSAAERVGKVPANAAPPLQVRVAALEARVAELESRLRAGVPAQELPSDAVARADFIAPAEVSPAPELIAAPEVVTPVKVVILSEVDTPAPPAPPPSEPAAPHPILAWLTGGNTIARLGLLILFIGLAFLLKYAADNALIPVELRVAAVAAVGIALLVVGWRLRERRPAYALGLQGAGVAVLYLTTFGALRLWHLIAPEAAFVMLAAIAVFSAILAVRQDALALAVIGAGGGFLAPILASTGGGNHAVLFTYYLMLNLGVAGIAFHKAWRPLNVLGFVFTFLIGTAWGMRSYRAEQFESVELFLGAFFLLFVAIAILYARKQAPQLKHFVDGTLVFGVPLAAFGLQAALVRGMEMALAYSALGAAALYIVLAVVLRRRRQERYDLLAEAFLALGVVFVTAAIPLALDARWTSAAWSLEGAAIVWIGLRQGRKLARAFGILLQLLAGLAYVEGHRVDVEAPPLLDAPFLGAMLIAAAALATQRLLGRAGERATAAERGFAPVLFGWGLAWFLFGGHREITLQVPREYTLNAHIVFVAATAAVLSWIGPARQWAEATFATRFYLPALTVFTTVSLMGHAHPFAYLGWIAWPFAFAVHFLVMRRTPPWDSPRFEETLHAAGLLLLATVGAKELHWVAMSYAAYHSAWSVAAVATVPALLLLAVSSRAADARWPVADHLRAYRVIAASAIAIALAAWSVYANFTHDGRSDPLPYLPLLNALDLAHGLAGVALVSAWLALGRVGMEAPRTGTGVRALAGAVVFIWLNGILLRTLHHWADVPYTLNGVSRSILAQAALSVFWSALALALMVYSTRRARRASGSWARR